MSQRLHVGPTDDEWYDCVITKLDGETLVKLTKEWIGHTAGPFKIRIADFDLFREIEEMIEDVMRLVGKKYPDDVWVFYYKDKMIEHPDYYELETWVDSVEE